ncbi:glycerol uptake facilitator protein [Methanomicrobium sp. W14]|jgi:glycerol uptake facilitator protein|uniref:MIP/aquaporin family protein n=1 Tax=Methanomicrobium sp. W14 TaxID=2817839 RepID=UPI001AE6412C|nr:MIP/aquaporin family protein [Methanomicrobium sp. W14]MBP2133850.1 glycerol uptake facilitator protein [Methanomicrobium sp. W14]
MTASLGKRFTAEAIGTMFLVYFGAGAASITLMITSGEDTPNPFNVGIGLLGGLGDWLAIGLAFGIAIMAAIYAFGRISGAHINPAVTIALWAVKKFPAKDTVVYLVAQFLGAFLGSILFALSASEASVFVGGLGATTPFYGISVYSAFLAEIIGTFVLMSVIMGVTRDDKITPAASGVIIGLTVAGIITTLGNVSGASLNPARSFGPMVADLLLGGPNVLSVYWIYVAGPVIGAVAAAFLYLWITREEA